LRLLLFATAGSRGGLLAIVFAGWPIVSMASTTLYKNNSSYFKLLARSHFLDGYLACLHSKSHKKRSHAKKPLKLGIVYPQTLHGKSHFQIQQGTGRSGEQWRRGVDGLGLVGLGFSLGLPAGFFVFL
jgi:hypothetical protein